MRDTQECIHHVHLPLHVECGLPVVDVVMQVAAW